MRPGLRRECTFGDTVVAGHPQLGDVGNELRILLDRAVSDRKGGIGRAERDPDPGLGVVLTDDLAAVYGSEPPQ
jgi:hypothetical protein